MANLVTPITPAEFAGAPKGSRIIDANGCNWYFSDEPTSEKLPIVRWMQIFNGEFEDITYTALFGQNNLTDEESGILIELNRPGVKFAP